MYKIKIIEKSGAFCEYQFNNVEDCNPTNLGHGLPERVVLADSDYDIADVMEEIPAVTETRTRTVIVPAQEIIDENGNSNIIPEQEVMEEYQEIISPAMVKLRAEYTIEVVDITSEVERQKINQEALKFLADTDWKIWRHKEQLENNIPTKLTNDEYQLLLVERQQARDAIVR